MQEPNTKECESQWLKIIMLIAVILPLLTLVAKGICHANNDSIILIDSETCPMFTPIAKCKCCKCFIEADENNIGICDGFKKKDWTYGDLKAVYCEQFTSK